MAEVKDETPLEEIKRRRDEWERRRKKAVTDGEVGKLSVCICGGIVSGLELAIQILEAKTE